MEKHNIKPGTPSSVPSKAIIVNWLKSLFSDIPISNKIQDFGDGVIYCRLLNHYYGNPLHSKITWSPKNQYQYCNNLRHAQGALMHLGIPITFDVNRISKRKFLENWHFNSIEDNTPIHEQNTVNFFTNNCSQVGSQSHMNYIGASMYNLNNQGMNTSRFPQGNFIKLPSTNSNQSDQRVPLKQVNGNMQNNTNSQQKEQRIQLQFGNLARNSLQLSQYLKQNTNIQNNSPPKGKWSVGSQMFQNNHNAVVDRVKQILLKDSHDTQKVRQIKMLLGMPLDEQEIIKIEDDIAQGPIMYSQKIQNPKTDQQTLKIEPIQKKNIKQQQQNNLLTQKQQQVPQNQAKNSVYKTQKKPFKI